MASIAASTTAKLPISNTRMEKFFMALPYIGCRSTGLGPTQRPPRYLKAQAL
jgi:hypothetical protein